MTETFLEDYFKNIAVRSVDIGHADDAPAFYRINDAMDLEEFDNAVRNMQKDQCLLLELGDGDIGEWDAQRDSPRIGLHLLVKTTSEFAAIKAGRDRAKAILNKIVSRMRLDCKSEYERDDHAIGPLKAVNIVFSSAIKYSNMSDVDGNWYGKSFYFEFKAPINLVYNANDWTV